MFMHVFIYKYIYRLLQDCFILFGKCFNAAVSPCRQQRAATKGPLVKR